MWLVKVKTASNGDVEYEEWEQPEGVRTVLTKTPIIPIKIELSKKERRNAPVRHVLDGTVYQRLVDAVKAR